MVIPILLIVVGCGALFYGAEWVVGGAARLAASFGVTPLVIGLTLVAFGTSAPELLVSLLAAVGGSSDIALGNVVGSNIANVGLILGATGLIFPIVVQSRLMRRELPIMLALSFLTLFLAWNLEIGRLDGLILVTLLIAFNSYMLWAARAAEAEGDEVAVAEFTEYQELQHLKEEEQESIVNRPRELARTLVGIVILMIGAQLLVENATTIARSVGISEVVIGMTLVAFGTSLPELATSVVAAYRKEDDISIGNVIGSNIYNLLAVLGITSMVQPISLDQSVLTREFPVMLAFSVALWFFGRSGHITRWEGALLLLCYIAFIGWLFVG
ncbi:MAG: calcium/sodium antiporter [Anaerolineales bacterium]|nr:calcium/sodium antiporter [Anaerolineales bacterium]MCB9172450.1 calcium/sodium antiporter [Ardenticatenales bacterium]